MSTQDPIRKAIDLAGGAGVIAKALGISDEGVRVWITREKVPAQHVLWLSARTGYRVLPHELSPALYPHPTDGVPPAIQEQA